MAHRQLKKEALRLLRLEDLNAGLAALSHYPARRMVNPLFGLLYHRDPLIRWHAVSAMGEVVSRLADRQIESARIIMRRFMWNLNDESGGIGWGSPESMGEIMARHRRLADEFGCILVSYADPCGNYLEHPILQRGVLWAWGRLGRQRPGILQPVAGLLRPYLASDDSHLQGLAAWAAVPLRSKDLEPYLKTLASSAFAIDLYIDDALQAKTVGQLSREALEGGDPS